jgi:hypothetical protein
LGGYSGGESSDSDIADVPQEMLDTDFFGFFSFDY